MTGTQNRNQDLILVCLVWFVVHWLRIKNGINYIDAFQYYVQLPELNAKATTIILSNQ
jgi:hypothetical protein